MIAALVDGGPDGKWAAAILRGYSLAAPHLMPVEVANILRRAVLTGDASADTAAQAFADLMDLRVELYPFEPFAQRVWELRNTVTACDAWYVALSESISADLVTLDQRLARAPGTVCTFQTPG